MRKLKLQVQMSVDGFVAGPSGELDWMTWDMDDKLSEFINKLTDSSDTILLGRKMTPGFITYWESVKPGSVEYDFAQKMINTPKVVFSKTIKDIEGKNVRVENGDLKTAVNELKNKDGKDIVVYGGAEFDSSLIKEQLIDEYNFFINPVLINRGLRIFDAAESRQNLELVSGIPYDCGIAVLTYRLKRN